ncbi:bactofilin family protein [Clostridium thermarum]|uniref:bactofilin family protein n=1 Tax=Clostridium thermarum TaxID=1716543 RepID=UPI00111CB8A3|nr:polymer-forming cytoskeletal protein [Clostridium thermarum]
MFSDKDSKNIERIETLIGEQCNIVGNLNGGGLLKVDGSIDGDILWQDDVILGVFSIFNGNLTCKSAIVSGKVTGNIICEETLIIESSGKVSGDITVKKLVVKEGGMLDGKCTMIVERAASDVLG